MKLETQFQKAQQKNAIASAQNIEELRSLSLQLLDIYFAQKEMLIAEMGKRLGIPKL